jgi:hypothetical protein
MDSMCAVRNLSNGGGSVEELCALVKLLWNKTEELKMVPSFRWMSRGEMMMQGVDALSKLATQWHLRVDYVQGMRAERVCDTFMPDVTKCEPFIIAAIAGQLHCAGTLPQWEGKSWWDVMLVHAKRV